MSNVIEPCLYEVKPPHQHNFVKTDVSLALGPLKLNSENRDIHFSLNTYTEPNNDFLQDNKKLKAARERRHPRATPYSIIPPRKDLFLKGFQDCASEAVRFLKEVEQIDESDPLLAGLESHLRLVSHAFCRERIADICFEMEHSPVSSTPAACGDMTCSSDTQFPSPNFTRQTDLNSSLSECDSSLSQSFDSGIDVNSSHTSDLDTSFLHSSTIKDGKYETCKQSQEDTNLDQSEILKQPSYVVSPCTGCLHEQSKHKQSPLGSTQSICFDNVSPSNNTDSLSNSISARDKCGISAPNPLSRKHCPPQTNSFCSTPSSNTSSHNKAHNDSHIFNQTHLLDDTSSLSKNNSDTSHTQIPSTSADCLRNILELQPNFLLGIDTSSHASGDFTDTVIGIQSCQHHHDPKVRELANELLHLINDDISDEEDDDGYDENEIVDDDSSL